MADDSIILVCSSCGLIYLIELMVEDQDGNLPNPMFCPFCGADHNSLSEGDYILIAEDPSFSVETERGGRSANCRPKLQLVSGGRDNKGGHDGDEESGSADDGEDVDGEGVREGSERGRHPRGG